MRCGPLFKLNYVIFSWPQGLFTTCSKSICHCDQRRFFSVRECSQMSISQHLRFGQGFKRGLFLELDRGLINPFSRSLKIIKLSQWNFALSTICNNISHATVLYDEVQVGGECVGICLLETMSGEEKRQWWSTNMTAVCLYLPTTSLIASRIEARKFN